MAATSSVGHRGRFGDTTLTKVFVGGLAWETPTEQLHRYFEQFGEILEAVVITDKNIGRSKGYGFVTFRDPESARRSVADPNPVIDGRRANCNIAALGRPRSSPPRGRIRAAGSIYSGPRQPTYQQYSRVPSQMPPPPPPVFYPTPYGYMTYISDYGYQQTVYNPQLTPQYYHQMYGSSSSNVGPPPYYPQVGYTMPTSRASYPSNPQAYRPVFLQCPLMPLERSFTPSSSQSHGFELQAPPHARQPHNIMDSRSPQQPSTTTGNSENSNP